MRAVPALALLPALVLGLSLAVGSAVAATDDDDDDDEEETGPPVGQPLGSGGVRLLNGPAVPPRDRFVVVASPAQTSGSSFATVGRRGEMPAAVSPARPAAAAPAPTVAAPAPARAEAPVAVEVPLQPHPAAEKPAEAAPEPDIRRSEQDANVRLVRTGNPLVEAARSRARDSLDRFIGTASNPPAGAKSFMLKIALRQSGQVENIWVGSLAAAPAQPGGVPRLSGQLANTPQFVKGLRLGQRVAFTLADVTDWMYVGGDGKMVGNFTACALAAAEGPAALESIVREHRLDCGWLAEARG
jgi:uncharacterized protein YegJ (DUF2314 family)